MKAGDWEDQRRPEVGWELVLNRRESCKKAGIWRFRVYEKWIKYAFYFGSSKNRYWLIKLSMECNEIKSLILGSMNA